MADATVPLKITWAPVALAEAEDPKKFTAESCGGVDPKTWHEDLVKKHAEANKGLLSGATKARIRHAAHPGGQVKNESEHITVSYKAGNKEIQNPQKLEGSDEGAGGGWHVYTDREMKTQ